MKIKIPINYDVRALLLPQVDEEVSTINGLSEVERRVIRDQRLTALTIPLQEKFPMTLEVTWGIGESPTFKLIPKLKNPLWQNILDLANFVEKIEPSRFDFGTWVGRDWGGAPDLSCGTTACALGWATTMPKFRALGLSLTRSSFHVNSPGTPAYQGRSGWDTRKLIGQEIFGLEEIDYEKLFYSGVDSGRLSPEATPKRWAEHARDLVARLNA